MSKLYQLQGIKKKKVSRKIFAFSEKGRQKNVKLKTEFLRDAHAKLADEEIDWISIDESIFQIQKVTESAYAYSGQHCVSNQRNTSSHGKNIAVLGAVSSKRGKLIFHYQEGYYTAETFVGFIDILYPFLHNRKHVICMDNCGIHRTPAVR